MKTVRIDLFQPVFSGGLSFSQFLQELNHKPKARRLRNLSAETALYIPNAKHSGAHLWTGGLQHIRKTNLPGQFDLSTLIDEALGLPPNKALVEVCHFAYRVDLNALALQASRLVKPSTFAGYVAH